MDERLRRIAAKLAIVPHLTHRAHSPGEEEHGFRPGPPLPEAEVAEYEARQGIELPRPYREFLTTIGHGGAGPFHGLALLDEPGPRGHPSRPFPLTLGERPGADWWRSRSGDHYDGTVPLVRNGSDFPSLLVVTGPARGRIVNTSGLYDPPVFSADPDFLAWYERWLDEIADGLPFFGFRWSIAGTEASLVRLLRDDPDPFRRGCAAHTLGRYPVPSPRTRAVLAAAARRDPAPEVRLTALGTMWPTIPDHALSDPDPGVRAAKVRVLPRADPRARTAVHDPHEDVRDAALASDALTEEDVLHLVSDPSGKVRANAVLVLSRRNAERAIPVARAALDDPHGGVRHFAVIALMNLGRLGPGDVAKLEDDPNPGVQAGLRRLARRPD